MEANTSCLASGSQAARLCTRFVRAGRKPSYGPRTRPLQNKHCSPCCRSKIANMKGYGVGEPPYPFICRCAKNSGGTWGSAPSHGINLPCATKRLALRHLLAGTRHPIVLVLDGKGGASSQPNVTDRLVPGW